MIVVVAYDVSDSKRRRRLADALSEIGWRLQESVFECVLDGINTEQLERQLRKLINIDTDVIHLFRQCTNCYQRSTSTSPTTPAHQHHCWQV